MAPKHGSPSTLYISSVYSSTVLNPRRASEFRNSRKYAMVGTALREQSTIRDRALKGVCSAKDDDWIAPLTSRPSVRRAGTVPEARIVQTRAAAS